ncbi:MAG: DUF2442 domain-containing protein [Desulfobacteraceae bacterium]
MSRKSGFRYELTGLALFAAAWVLVSYFIFSRPQFSHFQGFLPGPTLIKISSLKNPALFKAVQVEPGGFAVAWNNEIDISEYELWKHGQTWTFPFFLFPLTTERFLTNAFLTLAEENA